MPERRRGQTVVSAKGVAGPPPEGPAQVRRLPVGAVVGNTHLLQRYLMDAETRHNDLASRVASNVFGDGVLLRGFAVTGGGTTYIKHRLGRAYRGYFVTRVQTNPVLYVEITLPSNMSPATWLALQFSASATLDLYIF